MKVPTELEIVSFCKGCDNLKPDDTCALDQPASYRKNPKRLQAQKGLRKAILGILAAVEEEVPVAVVRDLNARVAGITDQQRYVLRGQCGWASVDGKRGEMTTEGFESGE